MSDDEAASVGVNLARYRLGMLVLAGVLTATAVTLAGPIGFVGLVCPHVFRLIARPSHRTLVVGAALLGIAMTVGADAIVRSVRTDTGRLPIGVVTSLVGGPVFIVLLRATWGRGGVGGEAS